MGEYIYILDSILNNNFKGSLKSKPYNSRLQNFLFMLPFMILLPANCVSNYAFYISQDKN